MKSSIIFIIFIALIFSLNTCKKDKEEKNEKGTNQGPELTVQKLSKADEVKDVKKDDKATGSPFPEFTLKDSDDKTYSLKDYKDKKLVIINVWADWCVPCRKEIPDIVKLQEKYKDEVAVLSMVIKSNPEKIKKLSEDLKINYPILWKGDDLINSLKVERVPTTFIVNKKGNLVNTIIGEANYSTFEEMIKKYK